MEVALRHVRSRSPGQVKVQYIRRAVIVVTTLQWNPEIGMKIM